MFKSMLFLVAIPVVAIAAKTANAEDANGRGLDADSAATFKLVKSLEKQVKDVRYRVDKAAMTQTAQTAEVRLALEAAQTAAAQAAAAQTAEVNQQRLTDMQMTLDVDTGEDASDQSSSLKFETLAGLLNHEDKVAAAFGVGVSMPVAQGEWQTETEALVSLGDESIGFTAIGRGTTHLFDTGLVVGPNLRFQVEGPEFSEPASAVFVGGGGSIGWQNELFCAIADVSVGALAHKGGDPDIVATGGLLVQVRF